MSICHVPFSVYQFWASQVQCESLPCWATEWALGSVNSTRWKGLGPGILHSLRRYSLDNPSKFFPLYCPSKISQCCLERNIWRVRKEFLFCYLSPSRTSLGFGGCDWCGWETDLSKRVLCEGNTQDLPSRGYLLQNGFVGSQPPELWWIGFCAFWPAWRPVVFCFMFEHQWWRAGWLAVCHPVYPTGINSFGTTAQLAELCGPLW